VKTTYTRQVLVAGTVLLLSGAVVGQPLSSAMYTPTADVVALVEKTETTPTDNAVLVFAPEQLGLLFPFQVRLVKLTLRNDKHDWVDISFRYDPQPEARFDWTLPELQQATYYTAEWAILGDNDQLVRGAFSFSFGPEAEAPALTKQAEEVILQQRYGDPNIRYVAPPPTQIILDQDPPTYDPPFTIKLQTANPD
jgi:copper resistance protein C